MSTLTGNQIKDTYQGLLKLADSSTGITQNLQSVQDGLGNDTGIKLAQNQFEATSLVSYIPLKAQYYGAGFLQSGSQLANGTQNIILSFPFYDGGKYSYTAMSYNIITATTSSDVVSLAFYTAQMTSTGLLPYEPIVSGITLNTTPVGLNTTTFGSDLSFSAYGAGIYFAVYKVSNAGVQPTIRYGTTAGGGGIGTTQAILGITKSPGILAYQSAWALNGSNMVFTGQTTFDNPFASTLGTLQSTANNITGSNIGFILHTKDF